MHFQSQLTHNRLMRIIRFNAFQNTKEKQWIYKLNGRVKKGKFRL